MKKLLYLVPFATIGLLAFILWPSAQPQITASLAPVSQQEEVKDMEKIYVALEGEGTVAVIDAKTRAVATRIDLSEENADMRAQYMAHNVQVAPNGKKVWVAANVMEESMGGMKMEKGDQPMLDQVIVIDPLSDTIIKRIPIGEEAHLAHVVVTPDNKTAYLTSQEKGEIYKINAETYAIEKTISLGATAGPHGLRMSPDGSKAFIALVSGKAIAELDTRTGAIKKYPTQSGVVQTAVTPDGRYAFASLYTTRQIARLNIALGEIALIDLPAEAKGPVQIYPTPDSRFLYVADQGYYFDQPTSTTVYRIDIERSAVDQTIPAGTAPHGIVVDKKGTFAYLTNLLSDDVSVIDIKEGKEVARIPVGTMPNGISVWNSALGGTQ